jgi:hypothetical protein
MVSGAFSGAFRGRFGPKVIQEEPGQAAVMQPTISIDACLSRGLARTGNEV